MKLTAGIEICSHSVYSIPETSALFLNCGTTNEFSFLIMDTICEVYLSLRVKYQTTNKHESHYLIIIILLLLLLLSTLERSAVLMWLCQSLAL